MVAELESRIESENCGGIEAMNVDTATRRGVAAVIEREKQVVPRTVTAIGAQNKRMSDN